MHYRPKHRRPLARPYVPHLESLEDRRLLRISLGRSFAGLAYADSGGYVPPDTHAAAGPTHLVEVVNSAVGFFDKATGARVSRQALRTFFAPVSAGTFIFDPVVTYDSLVNRFVVAALDRVDGSQTSFLLVAVSNTADPRDGFREMHRVPVLQIGGGGRRLWGDYPKIGWNADALIVTMNMFQFGGAYEQTQLVTFQKTTLLDANPATLTRYHVTRDRTHFTMAAATMHAAPAGSPLWFVEEAGFASGTTLRVVRMTNVLSPTPAFADFNLGVSPYLQPPPASQPGGGSIRTNDTRMLNAEWRGGRLVATHTIGLNGDPAAHARWYEFSTAGASPVLVQQGTLAPGAGVHTYYPAIAIAANGDLGLTFMQSSTSQFMSVYITGRKPANPPGQMHAPLLVRAGQRTYTPFDPSPHRAGDYSGLSVDPVTGTTFWAASEYATNASGTNWGTWIAHYGVDLPASRLRLDAPPGLAAGHAFTLPVTVLDAIGNPVPEYRGTVTFSSSDAAATLPADYTFTAADAGLQVFPIALSTSGPQTVTVRDRANPAVAGSATLAVADPVLNTPVNYGVGGSSLSVAAGDFNGDGALDLATAIADRDTVSVLLGNGNGTFQAAVEYGTGSVPYSVTVGDFNGDKLPDLAVANYQGSDVTVLLGLGDGTFEPVGNFSVGASARPVVIAVGDVTSDGILDLVTANEDGSVSVLPGNGDGSFQDPLHSPAALSSALAVAVADFNGDGWQDLAVADSFYDVDSQGRVAVLLGTGDGFFRPNPMRYTVGRAAVGVAVGDFDGDGVHDLAVANSGSNTVSVLLGNPNGTFRTPRNYRTGFGPSAVAVGDFNGDSVHDLATANSGSNTVSVLLGNGDGSFADALDHGAGDFPAPVAAGDFNGDGRSDLAVGNVVGQDVSVLLTAFLGPRMPGGGSSGGRIVTRHSGDDLALDGLVLVSLQDEAMPRRWRWSSGPAERVRGS